MKYSLFPTDAKDPEEIRAKINDYRKVFFNSPEGMRVFKQLLIDWKHFEPANNTDDMIFQNYAKKFLRDCGVLEISNVDALAQKYSETPTYRSV